MSDKKELEESIKEEQEEIVNEHLVDNNIENKNEEIEEKEEVVEEKDDDVKPLIEDNKEDRRKKRKKAIITILLFILLIVLIIADYLTFSSLFKSNNNSKDNVENNASENNKDEQEELSTNPNFDGLTMEEIMEIIGTDAENFLNDDWSQENVDELEEYLSNKYNLVCDKLNVENYLISFNNCLLEDREDEYTYTYVMSGYEEEEEENKGLKFKYINPTEYKDYTKLKIVHPTSYDVGLYLYDVDNKEVKVECQYSDDSKTVTATFEIENGYVYANTLGKKIKVKGIKNAKQIFTNQYGWAYSIFVLTTDNKTYIFDVGDPQAAIGEEEFIAALKNPTIKEIKLTRTYKKIIAASEGGPYFYSWVGVTNDDKMYVIDEDGEVLLTESFPYAYPVTVVQNYYVDLKGNVKTDYDDYKIKASYIFSSYLAKFDDYEDDCDFILDTNNGLNMICEDNESTDISVRDVKVSEIYYKATDDGYDVIFIFEDKKALKVEEVYLGFGEF